MHRLQVPGRGWPLPRQLKVDPTTLEQLRSRTGGTATGVALPETAVLEPILAQALAAHGGLQMLLLSSSDGRALAWQTDSLAVDPRRAAAMSNAFLTLGETLARELGLSSASHVTLSTEAGNVVLVRVQGRTPCMLASLANANTPLALVLYSTRECARHLATLL